ncbi:MAG: hypothetical protein MZV64_64820 [Ignavibacteriales bacterium]|nr:hypothetical protein [Ignavibacteriales bacterium]
MARAVKRGDFSKRVKVRANDRIARLGININKMIEGLARQENKIKDYQKKLQEQKEYFEALFNSIVMELLQYLKTAPL